MGRALEPIVLCGRNRWRTGRGFSLAELQQAGLTLGDAKRLGVPIDRRRRSCWPENVEALKQLAKPKKRRRKAAKKKEEAAKEKAQKRQWRAAGQG